MAEAAVCGAGRMSSCCQLTASNGQKERHFVLTCLCSPAWAWVSVRLMLPKSLGSALKPVVALSHCHHPTQRPPPRSWKPSHYFRREWQPLQFLATSSLRASRSLSVSQRECLSPAGAMIIQNFPLAVVNPFSSSEGRDPLALSDEIVASQEASVKSLELTTTHSHQMLSAYGTAREKVFYLWITSPTFNYICVNLQDPFWVWQDSPGITSFSRAPHKKWGACSGGWCLYPKVKVYKKISGAWGRKLVCEHENLRKEWWN